MKKLYIIAIITITMILAAVIWTSNASAQHALPHLWGGVEYDEGGGVGALKPVVVNFEGEIIKSDYDTVYTNASSLYQWNFERPQYVYKVSCRFQTGGGDTWYSGETTINQTLTGDTRVDITVYEE